MPSILISDNALDQEAVGGVVTAFAVVSSQGQVHESDLQLVYQGEVQVPIACEELGGCHSCD